MLDKAKLRLLEKLDDWDQLEFVSSSEGANQKKQQLLEMARNGELRPNKRKHPLGQVLGFYTNPNSECYDVEFDNQIRKLRPDWFIFRSDVANQKKQQFLEMACNGESRPHYTKHPLGYVLYSYTNPKRESYDPEFDKQIRKLRPDWFISIYEIADHKKQQLLEMARNGEPRPNQKQPLGVVLSFYTNPKNESYNDEFDKQIRKLRPDWFVSPSDGVIQNKQQLLEMAHNGEPRPNKKHPLGNVLGFYTNPNSKSYDAEFDKQIRNLRPDWFVSPSDGVNQKKQQILEMARNGEPRPSKKHPLGKVLGCYINPNNSMYDPEFDEQIRKLRPDWFKK